jgi:hypothetical protein
MRSFAWMQKIIHDYPIGVKEFDKIEREEKELLLITFEDLKQQRVLTLSQAAALIGNYLGRKPSISTCWRWTLKGVRGSKLESIRVGGKVYTTEPAIRTFITTLSTDITPEAIKATQTSPKESAALQAVVSDGLLLAKKHLDDVTG